MRKQDTIAWLQGSYNFDALSIALYNAFSKKGTQAKEYYSEPRTSEIDRRNHIPTEKELDEQRQMYRQQRLLTIANYKLSHPEKSQSHE